MPVCWPKSPPTPITFRNNGLRNLLGDHHRRCISVSTAGNLAFPFTPPEIRVGPAYEFSVYHLMEVERQEDLFAYRLEEL